MPVAITAWDWLLSQNVNSDAERFHVRAIDRVIWRELFVAPDVLRKRVALALSEIMVVSANSIEGEHPAFYMAGYWDTLNRHALGNFRDLLGAITLNPAMGRFLSTEGNRKADAATGRQPDENYAREVMQLFTIGLVALNPDGTPQMVDGKPVETYDSATVTQLARAFTGWTLDRSQSQSIANPQIARAPMVQNPKEHSPEEIRLFGQVIAAGTSGEVALQQVLDILFNQPNVGPFIARQLIGRLVCSNPSPAYVQRVATVFNGTANNARGDLMAVVRAILLDPEARGLRASNPQTSGKIREPILRLAQWGRSFAVRSLSGQWWVDPTSSPIWALGQSPLRAPSVFNFFRPAYVPPALASQQLSSPELQITDESTAAAYINFMVDTIEKGLQHWDTRTFDVQADYTKALSDAQNLPLFLSTLNVTLTGGRLSSSTMARMQAVLMDMPVSTDLQRRQQLWAALALVFCCPEYVVQQ